MSSVKDFNSFSVKELTSFSMYYATIFEIPKFQTLVL